MNVPYSLARIRVFGRIISISYMGYHYTALIFRSYSSIIQAEGDSQKLVRFTPDL